MQLTQQFYETTQGEYLPDLLNTGGRHTKSHKSRIVIMGTMYFNVELQ